jgi:hypothetical protein
MPLLRTSLLMSEPAGTLESLDELFALANAMEEEAANRYAGLAEDMRRQNKGALAEVFAQLAAATGPGAGGRCIGAHREAEPVPEARRQPGWWDGTCPRRVRARVTFASS